MLELLLLSFVLSGTVLLAQLRQRAPQKIRKAKTAVAAAVVQRKETSIRSDRTFMDTAAKDGICGMLLGTLAFEKSRNPHVRMLAEQMILNSQALNLRIKSLAERKGLNPAKSLNYDQRMMMLQLAQLSGQDFDCGFLKAALEERQRTLEAFENERTDGRDSDLLQLSHEAIGTLQMHIKLCRKTKAILNAEKSSQGLRH